MKDTKLHELSFMLHKVVFCMDKIADTLLQEKLELTFSLYKVLLVIDHKTVSQHEIAVYWEMTEAAVSRQVDLLISKKWVTKQENPENRRAHMLTLTAKGNQMLTQATQLLDTEYEKLFAEVSKQERKILLTSFHKLLSVVCAECRDFECGTK